jgi:hypothetical protein
MFRSPVCDATHQPNAIGILRPSRGKVNLSRFRVQFCPSMRGLQADDFSVVVLLDRIGAKFLGFSHLPDFESKTHRAETVRVFRNDFHNR